MISWQRTHDFMTLGRGTVAESAPATRYMCISITFEVPRIPTCPRWPGAGPRAQIDKNRWWQDKVPYVPSNGVMYHLCTRLCTAPFLKKINVNLVMYQLSGVMKAAFS